MRCRLCQHLDLATKVERAGGLFLVFVLLLVLLPKLPQFHRQRVRFLPGDSGAITPSTVPGTPLTDGSRTPKRFSFQ